MKTIGLIGGMSWESSAEYYRIINEEINKRLGGLHSAKIILNSVDFEEIEHCQKTGQWERAGEILADCASSLERAGADFILICTNTMHKVVKQIESRVEIPVLHIADATALAIQNAKIKKVGLLGTSYTMEQDFYKQRVEDNGIEVLIPEKAAREEVNTIIFNELCHGKIESSSREYYKSVIVDMVEQGAEGIVLGCTEIGLLIKTEDAPVPVFDTTYIHAIKAVEKALEVGVGRG
ncbi:aspartate/glutamate racemase family protein [Oceanobacillus picturae]|uniref:aspartate/glutamate racemase family protein n=1 Tax=Oceanobacillus picturae TaxID=171693 RepID=UPI000E6774DA|nr:aspartate/glutamate racemase family protein [Oceanobacillus picturae]RIU89463.1 aspartate/glutamate racemase family protein [Oceanobacillus picturae]